MHSVSIFSDMLAKMFVPIRQNSKEKRIFNEHSIWLIMYRVLFHRQNLIVNKSGMHFYCIFTTWHVACKLRGSGYCYDSSDCLCAMALSKQLYGSISFFAKAATFGQCYILISVVRGSDFLKIMVLFSLTLPHTLNHSFGVFFVHSFGFFVDTADVVSPVWHILGCRWHWAAKLIAALVCLF